MDRLRPYIVMRHYPSRITLYADGEPMLRIPNPRKVSCDAEAHQYAQSALVKVIDRCWPINIEALYRNLYDYYTQLITTEIWINL